jgi:hypothetical protein
MSNGILLISNVPLVIVSELIVCRAKQPDKSGLLPATDDILTSSDAPGGKAGSVCQFAQLHQSPSLSPSQTKLAANALRDDNAMLRNSEVVRINSIFLLLFSFFIGHLCIMNNIYLT